MITRTLGEVKDLKTDIGRLERDLESTGTLKTVEDVQHEVDQISNDMCVIISSGGQREKLIKSVKSYRGIKLRYLATRSLKPIR